jgi:hypothetical protein
LRGMAIEFLNLRNRGGWDPKVLAGRWYGRVKCSEGDLVRAPSGNWREEDLLQLQQALAMFDSLALRVIGCDAKIEGTVDATRTSRCHV